MTEPTTPAPADPLAMATNLVASVDGLSRQLADDPIAATIARVGERAANHCQMAGQLALVSIAADVRRIADHLTGGAA